MKSDPRSCFVNSNNRVSLKAWSASITLQPGSNYYAYMTAYCYKSEHETSEALCQAEKEIKAQKIKEAMYKIVHVFKNACQVSVQESASFCLPEL